jgi:hypothetical protein
MDEVRVQYGEPFLAHLREKNPQCSSPLRIGSLEQPRCYTFPASCAHKWHHLERWRLNIQTQCLSDWFFHPGRGNMHISS